MEKLFSTKEAALHYSFSEAYFRKLIFYKHIEVIRLGRQVRMKKSVIDKHFKQLEKDTTKINNAAAKEAAAESDAA